MVKPVFVLIMSESCGHCANFKAKRWPGIKEKLLKDGKVDVVEITLQDSTVKPGKEYHPQLAKYIGWFPIMMLFNGNDWKNHGSNLRGIIKNGKLTNNGVETVPDGDKQVDYSPKSILSWVNQNVENNAILKGGITQESLARMQPGSTVYIPTVGSVKYRSERFL